jgi:hypothetical protein
VLCESWRADKFFSWVLPSFYKLGLKEIFVKGIFQCVFGQQCPAALDAALPHHHISACAHLVPSTSTKESEKRGVDSTEVSGLLLFAPQI